MRTARCRLREQINDLPLKSVGNASVLVGDIGNAKDSGAHPDQHCSH